MKVKTWMDDLHRTQHIEFIVPESELEDMPLSVEDMTLVQNQRRNPNNIMLVIRMLFMIASHYNEEGNDHEPR
jgi:hypothetical protein